MSVLYSANLKKVAMHKVAYDNSQTPANTGQKCWKFENDNATLNWYVAR